MLHGHTACRHLPHVSGVGYRAAASCQARASLPLSCFDRLLERFGSAVQRSGLDEGRWAWPSHVLGRGLGRHHARYPSLQDAFGQPTELRPGCGVPAPRGACALGRMMPWIGNRLTMPPLLYSLFRHLSLNNI